MIDVYVVFVHIIVATQKSKTLEDALQNKLQEADKTVNFQLTKQCRQTFLMSKYNDVFIWEG
jgi:hypothetical protein